MNGKLDDTIAKNKAAAVAQEVIGGQQSTVGGLQNELDIQINRVYDALNELEARLQPITRPHPIEEQTSDPVPEGNSQIAQDYIGKINRVNYQYNQIIRLLENLEI